ncbi:hypothetical protein OIU84_005800 [Salix udensis]|uniref:Uncharacterized protein n=1 Tax=Salix udensis TaxID=889485 RepID=A0AAD6JWW0_9ROSI|nr:hypothetical protein OIU84_005800 [Salix udensis]
MNELINMGVGFALFISMKPPIYRGTFPDCKLLPKEPQVIKEHLWTATLLDCLIHYFTRLFYLDYNTNLYSSHYFTEAFYGSGFSDSELMLVILTTLLKVHVRGGLFEKSRDLLIELDTLGFAKKEELCSSLILHLWLLKDAYLVAKDNA